MLSSDRMRTLVRKALHCALFAAITWLALDALGFAPAPLIPVLALGTAIAAAVAPEIAVALLIGLVSLPLLATDLLTGLLILLAAALLFPFLERAGGDVLILIASAIVLAVLGPVWAIVALAGLTLGASQGAAAAALACFAVQFAGLLSGHEHLGIVASGGTGVGLAGFGAPPAGLLSFGWLPAAVDTISVGPLTALLPSAESLPLFVLQPAVWAAGAAATGVLARSAGSGYRGIRALVASAAGVVVAAVGHLAVLGVYEALPADSAIAPLSASLALAVLVAAARTWLAPRTVTPLSSAEMAESLGTTEQPACPQATDVPARDDAPSAVPHHAKVPA